MSPTRSTAALVVIWIAGASACASATPASDPARGSVATLEWTSDELVTPSGEAVDVQRARVRVPEGWRTDSDSIELSVLRIPAAEEAEGRPPILYLAGGPGGSAIQAANGARWPLFDGLRQAADVYLMDQRGTSGADPFLLCPSGLDRPLSIPGTRENLLRMWAEWSRECATTLADRGVDLTRYESESAARDLDALRRHLQAEQVDLVAVSYGTQLAQAYARMFPDAARRVVLAGPEPLDGTLKPIRQTETQLAKLDSAVAEDPEAARAVGSFTGLLASVLARLEEEPAQVPVVDPLTGDSTTLAIGAYDVRLATAFVLGDRSLMQALPGIFLAMEQGEYGHMAPLVVRLRRYNTTAMAATTDCATGWDPADAAAIAEAARSSLLRDAANFPFPDICEHWPYRDLGPDFRSSFRSEAAALFVAGTMDGRTSPGNIETLARSFPDHRSLLIRGGAHDDDLFMGSPEIVPAIVAFLEDGSGPPTRVVELEPWDFME